MGAYLAHAVLNEVGGTSGGLPGDQTGGEVKRQEWYLRGSSGAVWDYVARPTDPNVARVIAITAGQIADNNHIGYDQGRRLTLWQTLQTVGNDPARITTDCDCDCSSMVGACCRLAGLNVDPGITTRSELGALQATGAFTILTGAEYTQQGRNLQAGDILHREGHTAVVTSNDDFPISPDPESETGFRAWMGWTKNESIYPYNDMRGWSVMAYNGSAYGRYQFDYQYGLVPFMQSCIAKNPTRYAEFQQFIDAGAGSAALKGNTDLQNLFTRFTADYPDEFPQLQNAFMLEQYYKPARQQILTNYGYDIENKSPYVLGALMSMAIRFGVSPAYTFFANGGDMDDLTLLKSAYNLAYITCVNRGYSDPERWNAKENAEILTDYGNGANVYQLTAGSAPGYQDTGAEVPDPVGKPDVDPGNVSQDGTITIGERITPTTGAPIGSNPYWIARQFTDWTNDNRM